MKRSVFRAGCAACAMVFMMLLWPAAVNAEPPDEPETVSEETADVSEEEIDAFFDNTVFVGDSVMLGYRNYAMARSSTWLGRPQFLAAVSFSTYSALRPVTSKSILPVYAGEKRHVEDSIAMMGAKRVFLFFGLNDISITGIDGTAANYVELVNRIRAQSPDAEIHIMSMTYTYPGKRVENLYNDNVRRYNETMKNLAAAQGWGFVDVANPLADENGDLKPSYSSDKYVHLKNSAYDVWSVVLRDYAKQCILQEREAAEAAAEMAAEEEETVSRPDGSLPGPLDASVPQRTSEAREPEPAVTGQEPERTAEEQKQEAGRADGTVRETEPETLPGPLDLPEPEGVQAEK